MMESERPLETVMTFIGRINAHDVEGLSRLMTPDHLFVDSLGNCWQGLEAMRAAWTGYFQWFPDYRISHEQLLQNGNVVAIFGVASGTYSLNGHLGKENSWQMPAAWKAVVREGLVAEWRIYTDNEAARRVMAVPKS